MMAAAWKEEWAWASKFKIIQIVEGFAYLRAKPSFFAPATKKNIFHRYQRPGLRPAYAPDMHIAG